MTQMHYVVINRIIGWTLVKKRMIR